MEGGGQRAEGRGQRAEGRGWRLEAGGWRLEDGGQRAEGRGLRLLVRVEAAREGGGQRVVGAPRSRARTGDPEGKQHPLSCTCAHTGVRARASMPMNCAARAFCARPSSGAVMRRTDAQGTFSSKYWSSKRTAQDAGDSRTDRTSPGSHRAPPCQQAITRAPARRRGAASSRVARPSIAASVPGCTVRSGSPAARVASLSTDAGTWTWRG